MNPDTSSHCKHECVCREYANNLSISYDPCCVTCPHDTRDEAIRQTERDKIYKQLGELRTEAGLITCVMWSDIASLFEELKGEKS